ncbi:uncharacterized protein LOC123297350 [Chrysoperla carnea]|uniref:uncharacterized protein LOC123297350 n=1 Tax=Chrysoperla carnea TaxID=189513 RepID=UPI001D07279D|nr:uncharacterized protein LOC123297350 [Chrysoperla carnea]XP_044734914.1 uncharacterized protein LOC123297350 [Chrysoperla carnea]XP_044734915.1 uncharacterized protein LOC123297350 [Chrysoperla carnea]
MEAMDAISIQEPKWRLDRRDSGHLFWRQDSQKSKVKFRCDVDIREFHRQDYERDIHYWDYPEEGGSHPVVMGITCAVCLMVTVMLPYFIIS